MVSESEMTTDKFELLQVTLLCDEQVGMMTLPKVALESLAADLVRTARGVIAVCTVDHGCVCYLLSLGKQPKWEKLEAKFNGVKQYPIMAPLLDGSTLILNNRRFKGSFIAGKYDPRRDTYRGMAITDNFAGQFDNVRAAFQVDDGRVLFFFNQLDDANEIAVVALDLSTKTWTILREGEYIPSESSQIMMADGNIMFVGGVDMDGVDVDDDDDEQELSRCNIYDVKKNQFRRGEYMIFGRAHAGICLMPDHHVFVAGGHSYMGGICEEYNPYENEWLLIPRVLPRLNKTRCLLMGGDSILIAGCDEDGDWSNFYIYDINTKKYRDIEAPDNDHITGVEFIPLY